MEFLLGDFFGNLISGKFLGVSKKGLTGLSRVCQVTETYIPAGGGGGYYVKKLSKKHVKYMSKDYVILLSVLLYI